MPFYLLVRVGVLVHGCWFILVHGSPSGSPTGLWIAGGFDDHGDRALPPPPPPPPPRPNSSANSQLRSRPTVVRDIHGPSPSANASVGFLGCVRVKKRSYSFKSSSTNAGSQPASQPAPQHMAVPACWRWNTPAAVGTNEAHYAAISVRNPIANTRKRAGVSPAAGEFPHARRARSTPDSKRRPGNP